MLACAGHFGKEANMKGKTWFGLTASIGIVVAIIVTSGAQAFFPPPTPTGVGSTGVGSTGAGSAGGGSAGGDGAEARS